jgi:hypothetical protein
MAKGYGRPPGGGGMGGGMGGLRKLQEQMETIQAQLALETVTATAGGGAIKITVTGDQHITAVEIDPELLKDADAEMLQDLVLTAVNLGLDQSRALQQERLGPLAGGLGF